jgi:hypothetical protein
LEQHDIEGTWKHAGDYWLSATGQQYSVQIAAQPLANIVPRYAGLKSRNVTFANRNS